MGNLGISIVEDDNDVLDGRSPTVIKVVGCGGGGSNAVNRMITRDLHNVDFIVLNTDLQALGKSNAPTKLAIGQKVTKGLGAGGRPEIGEQSAEEDKELITDVLRGDLNYDGVVVTDAMNMSAIAQNFSVLDSAKLAINAGVDIILMPIDTSTESGIDALEQFVVDVANLVDTGDISIENVNKAVTRILTLKENHGLLNKYAICFRLIGTLKSLPCPNHVKISLSRII